MKAIFSNIEFTRPYLFWLFLLLPLIWARFGDRRFWVIVVRSLAVNTNLPDSLFDPDALRRGQ